MYGLADCNNFFVSCERVFAPRLEGVPVVVLSNNDGCIISRSNEAKAIGIRMGQPLFQAAPLIRQYDVQVLSSNYTLYSDMSHRVMTTLRNLVPGTEVYSIDEAFLDLSGFALEELPVIGRRIAATVRRHTGIPISLGMSPSKTLAKVASKLCKRYPKLQNSCLMYRPQDVDKVLRSFPIQDVWGIGRRHTRMLQQAGIVTAGQFVRMAEGWVRGRMGITGLRTWKELQGEPCIGFEQAPPAKQQICTSRSFATELTELNELRQSIALFTALSAEKLRRQGSVCGQLQVFIATNRHRPDEPQQYVNRIVAFPTPTDSTLELTAAADRALKSIFTSGFGYKKAGVVLGEIVPRGAVQTSLFDPMDRGRQARLMEMLDQVNERFGRHTLVTAAQGFDPLRSNRNHVSPNYTTSWDELFEVKV